MTGNLGSLAGEDFCYLTTTGRVSGRPHTIEIWFALNESTLYMLSGGMDRSDWVKNSLHLPDVTVRIKDRVFAGKARANRRGAFLFDGRTVQQRLGRNHGHRIADRRADGDFFPCHATPVY